MHLTIFLNEITKNFKGRFFMKFNVSNHKFLNNLLLFNF